MNRATGIAFIFGAAIGAVATWCFTKKHYEQFAQEQIDSVKEVFSKRSKEDLDRKIQMIHEMKSELDSRDKIIENNNYSNVQEKPLMEEQPYVIEPEEFGDIFEYEHIDLTYYADGILADDYNEPLDDDDIADTVGSDFATHFGEYEDDAVYIRNDRIKADYAILMDERKHSEVIRYKHQVEVE